MQVAALDGLLERVAGLRVSPSDGLNAHDQALDKARAILDDLESHIRTINPGTAARREVWSVELQSLRDEIHGRPYTKIGVCGATGAGKSSALNALLDNTILPTDSMAACTAMVNEIAYHDSSSILGEIEFLSLDEFRHDLTNLRNDLVDEHGQPRSKSLSTVSAAWDKVRSLYPDLTQDTFAQMSIDAVIAHDPAIPKLLGTTARLVAHNVKEWETLLGAYVSSRRKKSKSKAALECRGAVWPIVRRQRTWCNARVLATGVVLVDIPGVADSNAAREQIAKDAMKRVDCFFIVAPITRAVDDKTAKDLLGDAFRCQVRMDGKYDGSSITFVATKCDDVSCVEVINALGLEDDPQLERLEDEIEGLEERKDAADDPKAIERLISDAQRRKNAFCSLKRSEFSRHRLQEDFRIGLRELDDAAEESSNPDTFDPSKSMRDYEAIVLPVHTVSPRDYLRVRGLIPGDGEPTCFTSVNDTGIPGLRAWCIDTSLRSRTRHFEQVRDALRVFIESVATFVQGVRGITARDRAALAPLDKGSIEKRLRTVFETVRLNNIERLKARIVDALEQRLVDGAKKAAAAACPAVHTFGNDVKWNTYRATMVRDGVFQSHDLNTMMAGPMMKRVAAKWAEIFEDDLFATLHAEVEGTIDGLMTDISGKASAGIEAHVHAHGARVLREGRVVLRRAIERAKTQLTGCQKDLSRGIAPHVRAKLRPAYADAGRQQGPGTFMRMKNIMHDYLDAHAAGIFDGALQKLLGSLDAGVEDVGNLLVGALQQLAVQVSVSISALWEGYDRTSASSATQRLVATTESLCISPSSTTLTRSTTYAESTTVTATSAHASTSSRLRPAFIASADTTEATPHSDSSESTTVTASSAHAPPPSRLRRITPTNTDAMPNRDLLATARSSTPPTAPMLIPDTSLVSGMQKVSFASPAPSPTKQNGTSLFSFGKPSREAVASAFAQPKAESTFTLAPAAPPPDWINTMYGRAVAGNRRVAAGARVNTSAAPSGSSASVHESKPLFAFAPVTQTATPPTTPLKRNGTGITPPDSLQCSLPDAWLVNPWSVGN